MLQHSHVILPVDNCDHYKHEGVGDKVGKPVSCTPLKKALLNVVTWPEHGENMLLVPLNGVKLNHYFITEKKLQNYRKASLVMRYVSVC